MCSCYGTHKGHPCVPVTDYVETCKQDLNKEIESLSRQAKLLNEAQQHVDITLAKTLQVIRVLDDANDAFRFILNLTRTLKSKFPK
jgi:hypothetical protein